MDIRILIDGGIFDGYPHGGIGRAYRELLPRIAESHPEMEFRLLVGKARAEVLPRHLRVMPWRFEPWNLRPSRLLAWVDRQRRRKFDRTVQNWRPDIFQSTYYGMPPFGGMRSVAMVYDLIDAQFPLFMPNGLGFVERQARVLREADAVVGISASTTKAAIARFGLERSVTATVHLDASSVFRPLTEESRRAFRQKHVGGHPFFLFVGSTGSYKNLATLIRAFGRMEGRGGHRLVLAGHGMGRMDSHVFDLAVKGRVEERIVRLVHPDDELLCQAYNSATAFVYPSLQEGFGIPLVEAMRCGTPVVASDIAVFREVCGEAALYFDPHDHQALAWQLSQASQPDARERLVSLGSERARAFSWDRAADELAQIYLRLAGAARAPAAGSSGR